MPRFPGGARHVIDTEFGASLTVKNGVEVVVETNAFESFGDFITGLPKRGYIEAEMTRDLIYDYVYKVIDYSQPNPNGITAVKMVMAENPLIGSRYVERLEKFEALEIAQRFGLSWAEFIQQEPWECDKIFEIADASQKRRLALIKANADK